MTPEEKDCKVDEGAIPSKKKKKKSKKGNDIEGNGDDDDGKMVIAKKKKKKKKKKDGDSDDDDDLDIDGLSPRTPGVESKKKKKKKKDASETEDLVDALADTNLLDSDGNEEGDESKKKKKKKKEASETEDLVDDSADASAVPASSKKDTYSVKYFQGILTIIRIKCERNLKLKTKDKEEFALTCKDYYDMWIEKQDNDRRLTELLDENNNKNNPTGQQTTEQLVEAQTKYASELDSTMLKRKKRCIKSAMKVFMGLDPDLLTEIEDQIVKGAIIAQATPIKLAEFASKSKTNEKLLKRLFSDAHLMKEMLLHGGARKAEYGNAMRIFTDCMEDWKVSSKKKSKGGKGKHKTDDDNADKEKEEKGDSKWMVVNMKIALACALELASPIYEFDSTTLIDPVERYKHFVDAHKSGELDPSFPFFSVWEMRQIVNCDAPNDQMSWCRKMVMSYAPHLTCLTDITLRYVYMLESDVRIRKPDWTSSPRTYPMVLSGGGNESVNSWFGRFLLKSFGLPSWGSKFRRKEGYTRWTPEGWAALNGADWNNCSWQEKTGKDFKTEVEARNKAPLKEYFKRLVTLQCLADIVDGDPSSILNNEKDVLHADRMWRSMSIVSMELLFQTEPEVKRTFDRKGDSLVVTNCEKYLEKFQNDAHEGDISYDNDLGTVSIPVSSHGFTDGNIVVIESFTGGKQLNFVAGGIVEYEIPDDAPSKTYTLAFEVCTVSSKQPPLLVQSGDDVLVEIKIPYTKGEWQTTDGIEIAIESGSILRFSRPNGSLGVAVKNIVLS